MDKQRISLKISSWCKKSNNHLLRSIEEKKSQHLLFIYWILGLFFLKSLPIVGDFLGNMKLFFLMLIPVYPLFKVKSKVFFQVSAIFLIIALILGLSKMSFSYVYLFTEFCFNIILVGLVVYWIEIRSSHNIS